jgi:CxxC motif-containing protein
MNLSDRLHHLFEVVDPNDINNRIDVLLKAIDQSKPNYIKHIDSVVGTMNDYLRGKVDSAPETIKSIKSSPEAPKDDPKRRKINKDKVAAILLRTGEAPDMTTAISQAEKMSNWTDAQWDAWHQQESTCRHVIPLLEARGLITLNAIAMRARIAANDVANSIKAGELFHKLKSLLSEGYYIDGGRTLLEDIHIDDLYQSISNLDLATAYEKFKDELIYMKKKWSNVDDINVLADKLREVRMQSPINKRVAYDLVDKLRKQYVDLTLHFKIIESLSKKIVKWLKINNADARATASQVEAIINKINKTEKKTEEPETPETPAKAETPAPKDREVELANKLRQFGVKQDQTFRQSAIKQAIAAGAKTDDEIIDKAIDLYRGHKIRIDDPHAELRKKLRSY